MAGSHLMRSISIIISVFSLCACTQRSTQLGQQFHFHDDGKAKPQVAIVPLYDRSSAKMPWNLSQELTEAFQEKIALSGRFYMTKDFDMLGVHLLSLQQINPFLDDINWLSEVETGTEFIVFLELVSHHLTPSGSGKTFFNRKLFQSYSLDMTVRVKVVDIRQKQPKVILQEIVEEQYYIPWRFSSLNYQKGGWSKTAFALSPIGMAHNKMVKRASKQIEEYILLAKMH